MNAIVLAGGIPVFADIRRDDYMLDPEEVDQAITDNTAAILPVNLFGRRCELDWFAAICGRHPRISLIQDSAQWLGSPMNEAAFDAAKYGRFCCFSFYKTKALSTFEGGMITCNEQRDMLRVRQFVDPITNRNYGFPVVGHNFRMPEPCCLIGYERIKLHWDEVCANNRKVGPMDGFYPYVLYDLPPYAHLKGKYGCEKAEALARAVREASPEGQRFLTATELGKQSLEIQEEEIE